MVYVLLNCDPSFMPNNYSISLREFIHISLNFLIQESPCINTDTEIHCTMPSIDDVLTTTVFYTVIVDNAEGPDSSNPALRIGLQPNPLFLEDGSALENNEYQPGSEAIIQIVVIPIHTSVCDLQTL